MATSPAKEKILKRIREALVKTVPLPFPDSEGSQSVYVEKKKDLTVLFAEEFTRIQGNFAFCENEEDLAAQLKDFIHTKNFKNIYCKDELFSSLLYEMDINPYHDLASCDASITGCEYLVARTGSIVLSAAHQHGRTASVYAPIHICIAHSNQIVHNVKNALTNIKEKYGENFPSFITFASGPSRTADIEKTLVTGVHGPKEVYLFLLGS